MIDILQLLRNSIKAEFHYEEDKGDTITLLEKQEHSECKFVKIKKGAIRTFTLELDKQNEIDIHPLLAPIKDLKTKCDYVIFCQKENALYVLVIELKSSNPTGWTKQTRTGEVVTRYLVGMIENYSKMSISPQIEFRYLLFSTQNANRLKEKKAKVKGFNYEKDRKFGFLFTRKPCNMTYPDLGFFLR